MNNIVKIKKAMQRLNSRLANINMNMEELIEVRRQINILQAAVDIRMYYAKQKEANERYAKEKGQEKRLCYYCGQIHGESCPER